ncbi:hypothetical protein RhiirA1_464674 [Rhizophagus irregularis]|uniref:Uncharacterized protein n=1 Tax=Rhizophagus irregularis TaxID=588596 RepID=A0A2N0RHK2_9GLOM|nr:hypothetical protein RhiirA1_464674 [Rhizophagus irregularis]
MTLMVYKYNAEEITKIYEKRYILKQKIYKLFVSQCKNIEELSWNDSQPLSFFPRTSRYFPRLHSLIIMADFVNSDALYEMAKIYKSFKYINYMKFDCKELIKALEKNDTITKLLLSSKANNAGILIEAIAKHCPKVEELTTYRGPKDFIHVKSLLLNNCRNLSSIVLNSLIQV